MSIQTFKFSELPADLKTQVFSFFNFTDWILVLSQVCSEWKKLCVTSTLPGIIDGVSTGDESQEDNEEFFSHLLKVGQQYNVKGFIFPRLATVKTILKIIRHIPRISWLLAQPGEDTRSLGDNKKADLYEPIPNFVTHFDTSLSTKMTLQQIARHLPNLTTLFYKSGVTLADIQKVDLKFERLKVLRCGVSIKQKHTKIKGRGGKKVDQTEDILIEVMNAIKKIAPNLEVLYMFYTYKHGATSAALEKEFLSLESAAHSLGIRLYCRDLPFLLTRVTEDPQAKFFMKCYEHNGLPYHAYTYNDAKSLLNHAIEHLNVNAMNKILDSGLTTLHYELTVSNDYAEISFHEYPFMAEKERRDLRFSVEELIPEVQGAKANQIIDKLRSCGYDVNTMQYLRGSGGKLNVTPLWSSLPMKFSATRRLFTDYEIPINWFQKGIRGVTIAHRMVVSRGTTVYVDLMEKQLSKEKISELMAMQDDKGNTPVHLFAEASAIIIDRLIPYVKHCWQIKNKKGNTPLVHYIKRCAHDRIKIKEPKLRKHYLTVRKGLLQETPSLEEGTLYSLFTTCSSEVLVQIIPLLRDKGANFRESGKLGRAIFFNQKVPLLAALKSIGVDLTETDECGSNMLHGAFIYLQSAGRNKDDIDAINFLIREGVNVNQLNKAGETPLLKALDQRIKCSPQILTLLLENGADPNLRGPDQLSPLATLCTFSDLKYAGDILPVLLLHGAKPVSIKTSQGYFSPLVWIAMRSGSVKKMKLLIDHGADPKERDEYGNSILHAVLRASHLHVSNNKCEKLVQFLLNYIDINDRNYNEDTPLHGVDAFQLLEFALLKGADINARNLNGDTPMMVMSMALDDDEEEERLVNLKIVDPKANAFLIDWTAVNNNKVTLLHFLVRYPFALNKFMELYYSKTPEEQQKIKAAFATHDEYRDNALIEAVQMRFLVQTRFLDQMKICVEVFGISPAWKSYRTVLHVLALQKMDANFLMPKVRYLIEKGADVNAQDYALGNTPLHFALIAGNSELVQALLENGADPKIKNSAGIASIDLAPNLITRYRGSGMVWRTERVHTIKSIKEVVEERKNEIAELDSDEDPALINSDNEGENDYWNEVDENDLEADAEEGFEEEFDFDSDEDSNQDSDDENENEEEEGSVEDMDLY